MPAVVHAVDSAPPARIVLLNALQHISLSAVTLVFPRVVAEAAGADAETITRYVSLAMVAMGLGTLIQAFGRRGIGSGYLLLGHCTILYLPFALEAARDGGLGAVAGLTIIAGCTEMLLSRAVRALRAHIPPEIIGVVILLLGAMLGTFGLRLMLGIGLGSRPSLTEMSASAITLATIIGVAIWGRAELRSLAVLVGVATGCVAFLAAATLSGSFAAAVQDITFVTPHWPLAVPVFPIELVPGFLIGALACFIRAIADLSACQQLANPNLRAPDFQSIRAGTLADGLGCVVAGIIGLMGTNTYSGSVGLAAANGVLARRVGVAAGVGWIALGLLPGAASVFYAIPAGIPGAACLYAATFTIRTGITMLSQRLVDARRTFIIGTAIATSMLVGDAPGYGQLPLLIRQVLDSPLAAAMLLALALNAVLRLGIPKTATLHWPPETGFEPLKEFAETQGSLWGARVDLISRASNFLEEFSQAVPQLAAPRQAVELQLRHNDVGLQIKATWPGEPLPAADRPDIDAGDLGLQIVLMRHWADEMHSITQGNGYQTLVVHIDDH